MIAEIAALARETAIETGKPILDPRVIEVLGKVPRHRFVPADELRAAYRNRPLPIGHGQTISQPYIVALMTDLMNLRPEHTVLEIGRAPATRRRFWPSSCRPCARSRSSSLWRGRPTCACASWAMRACARAPATAITAGGVRTVRRDHRHGRREPRPSAADQTAEARRRMVIPVGAPFLAQHLMLVDKNRDGESSPARCCRSSSSR